MRESSNGQIALRNCLLLPPVTEGAGFTVIPAGETHEQSKEIASIRGANADYTKLSPAFKEALADIMDDTVPAEALAGDTRFVFEQESKDKDLWPEYSGDDNTARVDLVTNGMSVSVGELRAVTTHESAHAVTAEWTWDSEKDAKILDAFTAELYLGIEDAREKHGDELLEMLDRFHKKVADGYKQGNINSRARDALLAKTEEFKRRIKVPSGLGVALVDDGYGHDHTVLLPFRSFLLEDVRDADLVKMNERKFSVVEETGKIDRCLWGYLAKRFSYVTESMNMGGMVEGELGHPWDGSHEYIASLTANVELAPDKFVSSVKAIDGSQKERVSALILGIAGKYKQENPDLYARSNFPYVVGQLKG